MSSENCKIERRDFDWTLKNVKYHPGGEIDSVIFESGHPCHSLYYIKLYIHVTKTRQQIWSYKLVFFRGSYQKTITCTVRVVGKDGKLKPLPIFNPRMKNKRVLERNFFNQGTVTLRCRLTFPKECSEYTARLQDVSNKMGTLRDVKESSDFVLSAGGEDFHLQKAFLKQRCPKFFDLFETNSEERAELYMSLAVLKAILQYVYSGKYEDLPMKNLQEFYDMAKKLEFEEFTNEVLPVKIHANLCNDIRVIKKLVYFNVSVEKAVSEKVPIIKPVLLDSFRFFVEVCVTMITDGIWVYIGVRKRIPLENPIILNCIVYIGVDQNALEIYHEGKVQFGFPECEDININISSSFIHNKKLQKGSRLLIALDIVFANDTCTPCSIEDIDLEYQSLLSPDSQSVFGMGLLCRDLSDLCHKTMLGDGDVTLSFEDGELGAYRGILAVSSPVFYKMFLTDMTEKNSGEVRIQGIDVECGKRLLEYIYSRDVTRKSYESDLGLFGAVDRYQVSHFFDKPSALLVLHLTVDNAGDVLVEAYRRDNKFLQKEVVNYICLNRTAIQNSSLWTSLSCTHPEVQLISMVLQSLSNVRCFSCRFNLQF